MPRKRSTLNTGIVVSAKAFDAMCKAHAYCPDELGHLDRMRWMGSFMEAALNAPELQSPEAFELQPLGASGSIWDGASAQRVAAAAGLTGGRWSIGPEELAHILNTARVSVNPKKRRSGASAKRKSALPSPL